MGHTEKGAHRLMLGAEDGSLIKDDTFENAVMLVLRNVVRLIRDGEIKGLAIAADLTNGNTVNCVMLAKHLHNAGLLGAMRLNERQLEDFMDYGGEIIVEKVPERTDPGECPYFWVQSGCEEEED